MKSATRRKQHQDELRQKILDAARELFVAEGVEAVSMRKIADKIGYSATTLYNHFDDKDALLRALCDADFGALQDAFLQIGQIADPIERLRRLSQAYIGFALQFPSHFRFMFMTPRIPRDDEECGHEIERGDPDQDAYAFLRRRWWKRRRRAHSGMDLTTRIWSRRSSGAACTASPLFI